MGFEVLDSRGNVKLAGGGGRGPQGSDGAPGRLGFPGPPGRPGANGWHRRPSGILAPVRLNQDVEGNLPVSRLNGGSGASADTVWRGDGAWAPFGQISVGDDTGSPEVFFAGSTFVAGGTGNSDVNNVSVGKTITGGGASPQIDADGCWMRFSSTTNTFPSASGIHTGPTNELCVPEGDCWLATKIRLSFNPATVPCVIWFGWTSAQFTNVDTHAADTVAVRFSASVPDAGFVGVTRAVATGNQSVTSAMGTVAANGIYRIRLGLSGGGTLATFVVNGVSQTLSTNIPAGMLMFAKIFICGRPTSGVSRDLDVAYMKVWR